MSSEPWGRPAPAAWRDVDNERRRVGFYVMRYGCTFYVGKRCYRLRWWFR